MALLEAENVSAGYGKGPDILKGISLKVEEGRTCCIIGPNGAGKSTLLRIFCGLLHAREGKVLMISSLPNMSRRHIATFPPDSLDTRK